MESRVKFPVFVVENSEIFGLKAAEWMSVDT
jgi:hypothetical protein